MKLKNKVFCDPNNPFCDLTVKIMSVMVGLLGLVVMVGWHIESRTLVQIIPGSAEMTYSTALGFLLCGGGVLSVLFGFRRLGIILQLLSAHWER